MRGIAWAWAQAVLATVWLLEDGEDVPADHPWLTLAQRLESMLRDFGTGPAT